MKFPRKKTTESLILGTWNIRNFDDDRFDYGPREVEAYYYLAEVISWFDVIAVQEINADLRPLKTLMRVLGGQYEYIVHRRDPHRTGRKQGEAWVHLR